MGNEHFDDVHSNAHRNWFDVADPLKLLHTKMLAQVCAQGWTRHPTPRAPQQMSL